MGSRRSKDNTNMPPVADGYDDNSNTDEFMDQLSPSDGYFNQRPPQPRDVLIPQPSQEICAAVDKAREAREDGYRAGQDGEAASERAMEGNWRARGAECRIRDGTVRLRDITQQEGRTSQAVRTPPRGLYEPPHEVEQYSEHSKLLSSAPPAYSTVPAGSCNPGNNSESQGNNVGHSGYDITPATGQLELYRQYNEPQSMGLPVSGDVEAHGWRRRSRRCMVGRYSLGYVVKRLLVVGLVAVGIGLIIHAFGNIPTKKDQGTDPVPHKPGNIKLPPTAEMCSSAAFIETASFGFENPRDFQFLQVVSAGNDRETGYNVQTLGEVRIRPAVDHMESNIRVDLELHVSDRSLVNLTKIETSEGTLIMNTPLRVSGLNQPCLSIVATIWITPGLALGNMEIGTQNLGIQFYPLLEYTIRDTTYISSVAGSVHMTPPVSKIYSRKTIIETTSSSIRGAFPLYDLLSLTSQSGSMRVDVDPQEAAKVAPAPASFIASSASGSIEAYYPIDRAVSEIPDRDYRVAVKTSSAAIRGDYLHGSSTSLRSSSGSVEAILAPYGPVTQATNILTETQSASTRLTVLSSLTSPYTPMRNFYSSHKLASGSLRLHFPSTWEGEIEGWSMSGSLRIAWEGVRIIKDGRDWNGAWRRLIAVKGNGQGKIKFESMSGSMELEGD